MRDTIAMISALADEANGKTLERLGWAGDRVAALQSLLNDERNIATILVSVLRQRVSYDELVEMAGTSAVWEAFIILFQQTGRHHEALMLSFSLYRSMLEAERTSGMRLHKGMPLCRIADTYGALNYVVHEERYLMLTLCEDAIRGRGLISPNETGIYYRLVRGLGFSDKQVCEYAKEFFNVYEKGTAHHFFPEGLLQDIDPQRRWQVRAPSAAEMSLYEVSAPYIEFLLERIGDSTGHALERVSEYLLSLMAGCRAQRRVSSLVTEYDIVCSMNGNYHDFRSEFGRYFVCECKAWKSTAGIDVIAKFCRILDSTKARFGILFSRNGLSGMNDAEFAAREQQKIFQDRGLVIVVIDESDIRAVATGENFIQILRDRYEDVRLDLRRKRTAACDR